jgi:hypothetical protein
LLYEIWWLYCTTLKIFKSLLGQMISVCSMCMLYKCSNIHHFLGKLHLRFLWKNTKKCNISLTVGLKHWFPKCAPQIPGNLCTHIWNGYFKVYVFV